MDKLKGITWVGNFYQKFEEVCHEVDDIVGQDAVKYFENRVQNVGDSVKRFYSGVVQEVLPLPQLVNPVKQGCQSVALNNNVDSLSKSTEVVKENKKGTEGNPVNSVINTSHDCNAINSNDQHAQTSFKLDIVNQDRDLIASNSLEIEDPYRTQEVFGGDYSRETSDIINGNLHISIEQNSVKLTPQLLNLMSLNKNEHLESSIFSEPVSASYDGGCGAVSGTGKNSDATSVQSSCAVAEENAMKSSSLQVLKFMPLGEEESLDSSLFSDPSEGNDENSCGVLAVSPMASISNVKSQSSPNLGTASYNVTARDQIPNGSEFSDSLTSSEVAYSVETSERPITNVDPLCSKSSFMSDSLSTKSLERHSFELDSCKESLDDAGGCSLDSSLVPVSCATTPDIDVTDKVMSSPARVSSCGTIQSMESNDGEISRVNEAISLNTSPHKHGSFAQDCAMISFSQMDECLVNSIESSMESINLGDNVEFDHVKLDESCVFVEDSELHAVSCRAQKLGSYKKRIMDALAPKKRLEKEYKMLAIWYGDTEIDPTEGSSQTVLPLSSRRSLNSRNLQVQQSCETEWEIL